LHLHPVVRISTKSLKILIAALSSAVAYWIHPIVGNSSGDKIMIEKTCAACDCKLDEGSIKVKIGGKTVEVCCDECAQKLKEASSSSRES
jgi:hypothetical protein